MARLLLPLWGHHSSPPARVLPLHWRLSLAFADEAGLRARLVDAFAAGMLPGLPRHALDCPLSMAPAGEVAGERAWLLEAELVAERWRCCVGWVDCGAMPRRMGRCPENARPGGCQRHNLQCGYPACDEWPDGEGG